MTAAPEPTGERLARMETKLDAVLANQAENATRQAAQHADHETRIRGLERAKWAFAGFAAAGGGAFGAIVTKLIGG